MIFTDQMTKPTVSKHWRKPVGRRDQAWIPPEPLHHVTAHQTLVQVLAGHTHTAPHTHTHAAKNKTLPCWFAGIDWQVCCTTGRSLWRHNTWTAGRFGRSHAWYAQFSRPRNCSRRFWMPGIPPYCSVSELPIKRQQFTSTVRTGRHILQTARLNSTGCN